MDSDSSFPCSINLHIPFPTPRLASTALKALQVDPELSPLVRRTLSVVAPTAASPSSDAESQTQTLQAGEEGAAQVLLRVEYRAATNRMLRVAVNSFMEGLKLVVEVMEQLDVDVLAAAGGEHKSSIQAS